MRNGSSTTSPIISQCPVVVSFPALHFGHPAVRGRAALSVVAGVGSVCSSPSRVSVGRLGCCAVENVTEGVRAFVAEVFRVGQLADAEGVADDDDGARFIIGER